MTREELKYFLSMKVNRLDSAALAEFEVFFAEHNNVNENNYMSLLNEWRESENGKMANDLIHQLLNADKDSKIRHGLTTIERGDFSYVNRTRGKTFGTYVVYDNITRLRGLITENGEEVLPCIFDSVSVSLSAFIDARFKGADYEFLFACDDYIPEEGWFCYKENSAYILEYEQNPSPTLQQLIELLKINHTKK